MDKDLESIEHFLRKSLTEASPKLKTRKDMPNVLEVCGKIEAMQGKQKVDGYYFASVMPKPKDVRLYFFPIYTHAESIKPLVHPDLLKFLKGKSCFHIKYLTEEIRSSIHELIQKGVEHYEKDGLI